MHGSVGGDSYKLPHITAWCRVSDGLDIMTLFLFPRYYVSCLFHVPAASDLQICMLRGTYGCYESRPDEWLTFGLQRFVMWRDASIGLKSC
ncbi:hypothetical protein TNCT_503841 [Trichonephila clavata]|uniref:Uncharacterized protein n=1 Tax=Trichonephila clavata TaxID=2740835 RepID=A0A8X6L4Q8_TRICU|nr:hypothetical protein TNCT_503841 [Trichonephila clavata]